MLATVDGWPVPHAAAAVVGPDAVLASHGPTDRPFALASVTKPLAALACLVAVEEGAIELDDPAGPPGSTVRHLLAHASGLAPSTREVAAAPGTRRIYSNSGFDVLGEQVAAATGMPFADYLRDSVCVPLGLTSTVLAGSPARAATSTVDDLARVARELLRPRVLLHPDTVTALRGLQYPEVEGVVFPGLRGVLPGYGMQERNDWGLGFEIRNGKTPHWTGTHNSPATFGHFGQSGTFLWVDPEADLACVVLTDRDFGPWAIEAWPPFSDAVLAAATASARAQNPR